MCPDIAKSFPPSPTSPGWRTQLHLVENQRLREHEPGTWYWVCYVKLDTRTALFSEMLFTWIVLWVSPAAIEPAMVIKEDSHIARLLRWCHFTLIQVTIIPQYTMRYCSLYPYVSISAKDLSGNTFELVAGGWT